jgi:hypothetical protein
MLNTDTRSIFLGGFNWFKIAFRHVRKAKQPRPHNYPAFYHRQRVISDLNSAVNALRLGFEYTERVSG